ncbi:TPR repeat protein [Minicystis rosea]|nr:TPR repeat protein [Minicystis rosea]
MATTEPTFDEEQWESAARTLDAAAEALARGSFEAAGRMAEEAISVLREVVGDHHPDTANALDTLGLVAAELGRPREAIDHFRAALAIYDRYQTDEEDAAVVRPLRAQTRFNLGQHLSRLGDFAEAERLVRTAIAEAERAHGAASLPLASFHNGLGVLLRFAGRYREAASAYTRAEEIRTAHGQATPAVHCHNLSGLAAAEGHYAMAEEHARRAIALREGDGDEGDMLLLGGDLCGLGDALAGQDRHAEAEEAYRRALTLYARSPRPQHPEVAYALHNLGDALVALGRRHEAERVYRDSIARKTAAFGGDHFEVAATLNNLAGLLSDEGRNEEARAASARALAIVQQRLSPDHPVRKGCESLHRALSV